MVARHPPSHWLLGGIITFGRVSKPGSVQVLAAVGARDELLRDAAYKQHLAASHIQSLAQSASGNKSVKGARMWLVDRVVTMNRDTMRDVLTGRTAMTLTQLVDFERALGRSVYAEISDTQVLEEPRSGRP